MTEDSGYTSRQRITTSQPGGIESMEDLNPPFIATFRCRVFPALIASIAAGCATTAPHQQALQVPASAAEQVAAQHQAAVVDVKTLKRKVAIGRFTNETRYGKTFQVDANSD